MRNMTAVALRLAKGFEPEDTWDDIRNHIDQQTGGELDAFQLDLLTDMVKQMAQLTKRKLSA